MKYDFSPFLGALRVTIKEMTGKETIDSIVETGNGTAIIADVSASMCLIAMEKAMLVITASEDSIKSLSLAITGQSCSLEEDTASDCLAEVLNMVVGSAQRQSNVSYNFSSPLTVVGKDHKVKPLERGQMRYVKMQFNGTTLCLYLVEPIGQ